MIPEDHVFRPSNSDRFATCTASVEAEAQYEDTTSSYADAGTDAHDLLERSIKEKKHPKDLEPNHPAVKGVGLCYDVVEIYLNDPNYIVFTELPVELNDSIRGTVDIIILCPDGAVWVVDYKNGFVTVEANSRQLQLYLKAAEKSLSFYLDRPTTSYKATIVQPNAMHPEGPIRHEEYTVEALNDSVERIIEAVNDIKAGRTEFKPTEKGCKFCKHKANCTALMEAGLSKAGVTFNPVTNFVEVPDKTEIVEMTPERKAAIREAMPLIDIFLKALDEDALLNPPPGYKLVHGRSNRRLTLKDEELEKFLRGELKLKPSEYTTPKIVGIPALEELIDPKARNGKKKWEKLQSIIEKPKGKPTVVPESDKRPAIPPMFQEVDNSADPLA